MAIPQREKLLKQMREEKPDLCHLLRYRWLYLILGVIILAYFFEYLLGILGVAFIISSIVGFYQNSKLKKKIREK